MSKAETRAPLFRAGAVRGERFWSIWIGILSLIWCCGCESPTAFPTERRAPSQRSELIQASLRRLREHEQNLRHETRFDSLTPALRALGPDPYRVCALGTQSVGVLRGTDEVVLLDSTLKPVSRSAAPRAPVACAVTSDGELAVVGELSSEIRLYRIGSGQLSSSGSVKVEAAVSPRAMVAAQNTLLVADSQTGMLHEMSEIGRGKPAQRSVYLCRGPVSLEVTRHYLIANCLLDHALVVRALDTRGRVRDEVARVVHDGPFWSLSAIELGTRLLVAASGVEDRPLERFEGAFGHVDSFVYLHRFEAGRSERLFAVNTSDLRVLTPKALSLVAPSTGELSLFVSGYGSGGAVELTFAEAAEAPRLRARSFVPGVASLQRIGGALVGASPLLDAFVRLDGDELLVQPVSSTLRPSQSVRLGEALFFTELIAPDATSSGKKSRFTCETCHFEGGIDGRVHATGRGDVRVSTRPLFGLLQNRPHFSRALDPDLTSVSHNEFRVASLGDQSDPWFSISRERFGWLEWLGILDAELGPEALRRALLDFLAAHQPAPNPRAVGRFRFTNLERRGAETFEQRCETCHSARRVSDDPESRAVFSEWEKLIFSEASPLVWARGDYAKTGIVPTVHERGARIPSLRRIARKFPYFTDGSSHTLGALLDRVGVSEGQFFHAGAPVGATSLTAGERAALVAFLEIL